MTGPTPEERIRLLLYRRWELTLGDIETLAGMSSEDASEVAQGMVEAGLIARTQVKGIPVFTLPERIERTR